MSASVVFFRVETGNVRWLESAPLIEQATVRVRELAMDSPGEYLALDQKLETSTP